MRKSQPRALAIVSCFLALFLIISSLPINNNKAYAANPLYGVALKAPTNVHTSTSKSSNVLKGYAQGSILKFNSHNAEWYSAVVYLNGKAQNGYIHKSDVDVATQNQTQVKGVALQSPTRVYKSASTSSGAWKSYSVGSILVYRTFSADWYEATVYVNGSPKTGYIHKSHVENVVTSQESLKGVALQNPTRVYTNASTGSTALKAYSGGSILSYRTFSTNWYEATVYVSGKPRTGYIHKSHVENAVKSPDNLKGIGLQNPTAVYAQASTGAKKLKTYAQGTVLNYQTFSSQWYQAKVYISGKPTTGYIHTSHVEGLLNTSNSLNGAALKSPTNVYSRASKNANVLRGYPKGSFLIFKSFSPNWYEATVYINGKRTSGYIHRNDVSQERIISTTTSYPTNFKTVVDIQMTKDPKADGAGNVLASRAQVEYYVNSSNFSKSSSDYFQFLVLSEPARLNANEVNNKILNKHGILTGKAKSFIEAGEKFNINEAYLISHALLETGNGSSTLASGVPVDSKGNVVDANKAVYTVYNMYGIGAVDSNALKGGAKRAFDEGWFTPEDAIVGGAAFINSYIDRGQDTLYKMRWNPISPGFPQYATDVAWAVKQTANISKIYNLLDNYVLIYDIPRYANQPASSGDPNATVPDKKPETNTGFPSGVYGITNTSGTLNLRQGSNTSTSIVASIPGGSKLEIISEANGQTVNNTATWYQVKYSGKTGWVHSSYVDLLNLLEVTATSVNVRDGAGTSFKSVGSVTSRNLISAQLDAKNNLITKTANGHVWYQINFNNNQAWVSGGKNGTEYIKIR
ncbi:SH3 domain-containing protein [Lederbergia lenta]|uniref:Beta-N-acetylglucosaminidase n=1 Tax=Lederbergia lenta TaxID=1467 RepID=A0A2X4WFW4_LEDLE|nr:SH3 domain-containing protein [Lederbergia lenta]MCM3112011.1 SH3 domain-containing protein [Lederbergia lenta]MEC2323183.1 SH3 domain-containing protein [Lederbergia lenta]SQI62956.1 beta-N-acetylglucosaminidase [Lederbergia lenta]